MWDKYTPYDNITFAHLFHERHKGMTLYVGLRKYWDSSYKMQFRLNYYDAHSSK